jgi:hypothetical protein
MLSAHKVDFAEYLGGTIRMSGLLSQRLVSKDLTRCTERATLNILQSSA